MNATDLTTIDPSTHAITIAIILIIAFFFAVIFVGMALAAKIPDDSEFDEYDITEYPEDEDNVIFRG